jgi:hypothetical protein
VGVSLGFLVGYGLILKRLFEAWLWVLLFGLQLLFTLRQYHHFLPQDQMTGRDKFQSLVRAIFKNRIGFWLGFVLVIFSIIALFTSSTISLRRIPNHDSGIFLYFGQQILLGKIPFRDLWDHKPPLIFFADALGLLLGNGSLKGVWYLELLALLGSSLFGFAYLRRHFNALLAFLAVSASLACEVFLLEGGNLTEEFALPLLWVFLLLFDVSEKSRWKHKHIKLIFFLMGIVLTLTLNFKQSMIGLWIAGFLILLILIFSNHDWSLFKLFAWFGFGTAVMQAFIVLYFWINHSFQDYWQVAFVYNFLYSDISWAERLTAVLEIFDFFLHTSPIFFLAVLSWIVLIIEAVVLVYKRKFNFPFYLMIASVDFPIEIILISLSGKNYPHYFVSLLPTLSILVIYLLNEFKQFAFRSAHGRWLKFIFPVLFAALLIPSVKEMWENIQPSGEVTITQTVELIDQETQPSDYVLIWGSQVVVNFLSRRASPTRFVHQKPLFRAGYANQRLSDEILNDLRLRTPRLIINTHLPSTPFITTSPQGLCVIPQNSPDGMDAVFEFICQNYKLEEVITKDQWEVYKLVE